VHALLVPHVIGQAKGSQKHPNRVLRGGFLENREITTGAFHVRIDNPSVFPLKAGGGGEGGQGWGSFAIEQEGQPDFRPNFIVYDGADWVFTTESLDFGGVDVCLADFRAELGAEHGLGTWSDARVGRGEGRLERRGPEDNAHPGRKASAA